jgi:threonine dehydrogenase-like Zn-dependent dehydrogenase
MAEVRTVAVIGAGIMGRGIVHAAALGGYRTILGVAENGGMKDVKVSIADAMGHFSLEFPPGVAADPGLILGGIAAWISR